MTQVGGSVVEGEWPCFECLYDLRGQPTEGVCPECGKPVAGSLREDRWDRADARWKRRVVRGAAWSAWEYGAIGLGIVTVMVLSRVMRDWVMEWVAVGLYATMGFCAAVGGWWVTTPEPGRDQAALGWRRKMVRALSVVAGVVYAGMIVAVVWGSNGMGPNWYLVTTTAMAAVNAARGVPLIQYLRGLARRVPGRRVRAAGAVAAWAPLVGWGGLALLWHIQIPSWMEILLPMPIVIVGLMGMLVLSGVYEGMLYSALRQRRK